MAKITTLFWDIGGVLLTNGWDHTGRRQAAEQFHLDREEFEKRHELVVDAFEEGRMSLNEYLQQCVFYQARPFTPEAFKKFMFSRSQPRADTLAVIDRLARSGKYLIAALNNESLEMNQYRIDRFNLRRYFLAFFSSCYLGLRKPDERIYRVALQTVQRPPEACLLIDDRAPNLEPPRALGMATIEYQDPVQLQQELGRLGVVVPAE